MKTYDADAVRAEFTEEKRAEWMKDCQMPGLMADVHMCGEWLREKLIALDCAPSQIEHYCFVLGRFCFGRDPYKMAALMFNRAAKLCPMEPDGIVAENESVYDEKIAPLMNQIISICREHKMPMVACFQFAPDGAFCTTSLLGAPEYEGADPRLFRALQVVRPDRIDDVPLPFRILTKIAEETTERGN